MTDVQRIEDPVAMRDATTGRLLLANDFRQSLQRDDFCSRSFGGAAGWHGNSRSQGTSSGMWRSSLGDRFNSTRGNARLTSRLSIAFHRGGKVIREQELLCVANVPAGEDHAG